MEALVDARRSRELGRLDILVTAAGAARLRAGGGRPSPRTGTRCWRVNLRGAYLVLPGGAARRCCASAAGTIVNLGSHGREPGAARQRGLHGVQVRACWASRRVLAEEMRPHGVRVGVLSPGAVDTPLWDGMPGRRRPASRMLRAEASGRGGPADGRAGRRTRSLEELTLLPAGGIL